MADLQRIAYYGIASVTALNLSGPVLQLTGRDFVDVADVRINGISAPEWVVYSATRLDAQLPGALLGGVIQEIQVLRSSLGSTETSAVILSLGARWMTEEALLIQRFLSWLLTTPGTDLLSPTRGGGLLTVLRTGGGQAALQAVASRAVAVTALQMQQAQTNRKLPAAERLQQASLLGATLRGTTLDVQVRVTSMRGTTLDAGVTLPA